MHSKGRNAPTARDVMRRQLGGHNAPTVRVNNALTLDSEGK